MADSGSNPEGPPNPGRRRILKGIAGLAGAGGVGAVGGWKLRGIFSGDSENKSSVQVGPTVSRGEATPTPAPHEQAKTINSTWPEKRADGTQAFSDPVTPEERVKLEGDIDTVYGAVKKVLNIATLKESGIDVDAIVLEMKGWDDKELRDWSGRQSHDRTISSPDLEQDTLPFGVGTGIRVSFVKDMKKGGEATFIEVMVPIDEEGNYRRPGGEMQVSRGALLELPEKLDKLVKPPLGATSGYSLDKLIFESLVSASGEGEERRLQNWSLDSKEYPTQDGKLFKVDIKAYGPGYEVRVGLREPNVSFVYRGKSAPIILP